MLFFLNTVIQFLFYYSQIKCTKRTINVQSEFVYRVFQCIYVRTKHKHQIWVNWLCSCWSDIFKYINRFTVNFLSFYQYSGDQDDKVWLYENQHMPATGGKTYMLILEDIKDLGKEDDYRWKEHCSMSLHLNVIMYCKQTFICLQEIFTKGLQEHHHRQCLCRKN